VQKCAEKHQEKAVETAKESKNVVQGESYVIGREVCYRESAAIVCSTEVLQSAVKSFQ
jgi:hypothetical protein